MPSDHPYHGSRIPDGAPFELKPSPGKGWGGFATRRIEKGDEILREKPLFVIRKPDNEISEVDMWLAFQQLAPHEKEQFLMLRYNADHPFASLEDAFSENSFNLATPDIGIAPRPPGHGFFMLLSRFNHSCVPNAKIPVAENQGDSKAMFAIKDIAPGEEITFAYAPGLPALTRRERHEALHMTCTCQACEADPFSQELSDSRRRLIRGLQYLLHGVTTDGQRDTSNSPLITDPVLRRAAETYDIPIPDRLVYQILTVFLMEEEGLLDQFHFKRLYPTILSLWRMLETKENAAIAEHAMAQDTWIECVRIAFGLYGRKDAGDGKLTMRLRLQNNL